VPQFHQICLTQHSLKLLRRSLAHFELETGKELLIEKRYIANNYSIVRDIWEKLIDRSAVSHAMQMCKAAITPNDLTHLN
jgi:hypothetical protein